MTIVSSNSASPTMCNNEASSTNEDSSPTACTSCRKLHDEIKTTVTQMAGKLDSLVLRVEEIYRQQQILKGQVALNTEKALLPTNSTNRPANVQSTTPKASHVNGRRMSCTSTASEEQSVPQASSNLVDMLSSLLGDATHNSDGTASLNGVRLEPGVTVSFNNSDQQFKIESPTSQNNGLTNGLWVFVLSDRINKHSLI